MAARIAWLLNLDAELELRSPRSYRTDVRMQARIASLMPALRALVGPEDSVVGRDPGPYVVDAVLSFCPTPSALTQLRAARLEPTLPTPPLALLAYLARRVFSASLGQTLRGAGYVETEDALARLLAAPPAPPAREWLIKRDFSFAGRERIRTLPGPLTEATVRFARRSFRRGEGLQVEPWCQRLLDVSRHGFAGANGALYIGAPFVQTCDTRGVWQPARVPIAPDALEPHEEQALELEVRQAGAALIARGYVGPFGVDAFRYQGPEGPQFCARCEVNARFTMAYPRALALQGLGLGNPST